MAQGKIASRMANGNILPYSFVKPDTTAPFKVVQATGTTAKIFGVSSEAVKNPPIPQDSSTQYAAVAGDSLEIYMVGSECLLKIGTGGCTAGDYLTADASGSGVTATTGNWVGAIALDTRSAGELCNVQVVDTDVSP